jgi:hypothetical protein
MAVNVSKIKFIIFHTRGRETDPNTHLIYDDSELDQILILFTSSKDFTLGLPHNRADHTN